MRVLRDGGPQRLEERDVAVRVLHVVVAPDDVRDPHRDVVHDVGQVEDGLAVRAHDDEVLHVLRLLAQVALDLVVVRHVGPRHPEDDALALAGAALVLAVGQPLAEQRLRRLQVPGLLGGLVDGRLVPREAEPLHGADDGLDGLGRGALAVGVLDAQEELPALVAGKEPVEDGRPDVADVHVPGRAGRKARSDAHESPFGA